MPASRWIALRLTPLPSPLPRAAGTPAHLSDLMSRVDGAKQRSIIQHMSKDLIPIMEKGLVDCPLVHRCGGTGRRGSPAHARAVPACAACAAPVEGRPFAAVPTSPALGPPRLSPARLVSEFMEFSPASVVADAADNLCGDPLLHMVHTKVGQAAGPGRARACLRHGAGCCGRAARPRRLVGSAVTPPGDCPLATCAPAGGRQGGVHGAGVRHSQGPQEGPQVHEGGPRWICAGFEELQGLAYLGKGRLGDLGVCGGSSTSGALVHELGRQKGATG